MSPHSQQINSDPISNSHWIGSKSPGNLIVQEGDTLHISPEALTIIWGNSERFWKWINPSPGDRFTRVAEIIQVSWIEVTGKLDLSIHELASKTYEVIFKIKFKDDAFGWHQTPITFEVASPDGKRHKKSVLLETFRRKGNGVQEIHAGEFTSSGKGVLSFGMYETQTQWWKGGLIIEEVILRPKSL